jgi:hypothetical protein
MSSSKYAQLPGYPSAQFTSFTFLEMLWFRVHGGLGQLDDIRRSGQAPPDRGGAREVCPNSSISKPEQAALPHNVEENTQDLWGSSTGKAIPSHDAIHRVASARNSRSCLFTHLTSCNILNHLFEPISRFCNLFTAPLYFPYVFVTTTALYNRATRDVATNFQ